MKRKNDRSVISNFVVFVLSISLLTSQSMFVFANNERSVSAGEITVTGAGTAGAKPFVLVNGEPAYSGRTFFSNGTISTTDSTSASIDFGKVGRITLEPNSTLTLTVSETLLSGTLATGGIKVANGDGVSVKINTPDDAISNNALASRFAVNVVSGVSSVAAESGTVTYNNGQSVAARQDDDDDDDDGNIWIPIIVIGGAVGAVILFTAFDDDDEVVSPLR
jgi:hypothetical protein